MCFFNKKVNDILDFPGGSDGKASVYNAGDLGSIPGLGRCPGEGKGSSILAWRIPWGHKELDTTEQLHLKDYITTMHPA